RCMLAWASVLSGCRTQDSGGHAAVIVVQGSCHAVLDDDDIVADRQHFLEVRGGHDDCCATLGQTALQPVHTGPRADIQALGGFVEQEDPGGGMGAEPSSDGDLLLVAADEVLNQGMWPRCLDVELGD